MQELGFGRRCREGKQKLMWNVGMAPWGSAGNEWDGIYWECCVCLLCSRNRNIERTLQSVSLGSAFLQCIALLPLSFICLKKLIIHLSSGFTATISSAPLFSPRVLVMSS